MTDERERDSNKQEKGYQPNKRPAQDPGKVEGGYQPEKSENVPKTPPKKP
jgi:hypothetical protein